MRRKGKVLQTFLGIILGVTGLAVGITTLTVMGHGHRWASLHDELVGTPLTVIGFLAAFGAIIWLVSLADM